MSSVNFLSITDQVAGHLRAEILRGRWSGMIPGKHQLAAELGINNKTVEAALRQLEKAGLLLAQGAGRRRLIHLPAGGAMSALRIARITRDSRPLVRRIVHWATNVSQGKPDLRHTHTPAKYLPGGTVGPARES